LIIPAPIRVPNAQLLKEPNLEFAYGQVVLSPHDGLNLFGPYDLDKPNHPRSPPYIVIGSGHGPALFERWARSANLPAFDFNENHPASQLLWPPYPGFEPAFGTQWSERPIATFTIDRSELLKASNKKDPHERCFSVVELFVDALEKTKKIDTPVAVAICVVPDEVHANCRPKSRISEPTDAGITHKEKLARKSGQLDLFEDFDLRQYHLSPDFRRQLKARAMRYNIPIQIVRESTLRLTPRNSPKERGLTPLSDRMWNLGTALYYKCGGKPWRLANVREGVCYIGLAFRQAEERATTACCAAQMFLDSGDGVVFLGEYGPWYSPQTKQFHLSHDAARNLLAGVLKTYHDLEGKPLTEVFLHSRSMIDEEEFSGYLAACPTGTKLVGIRVRKDRFGLKLFRLGRMPVLRGTFLSLNNRSGYLYGAGFKPRLATYDGWEVPIPLRIDIQHGDACIEQVTADILGLTKLNYNACRLGESEPVTVGFSDAVGEILITNPNLPAEQRRPNFRFYI
jgi:hypothetical protein